MKKINLILILIIVIFTLTACSNNENNVDNNDTIESNQASSNSVNTNNKSLKASDLSIDDFIWETNATKYNGYDCYSLSLVNNSEYDIIGVDFTYKVKDDVTEESLAVYDDFMKEHEGYIEESDSPKGVILKGSKDKLVAKGNELSGLRFTVGYGRWYWYDYPTEEQFSLMEPNELQLGVVYGNKLYIAYYDFTKNTWKLDEKKGDVDTWTKWEIGNKITKPNENPYVTITNEENKFKICSYGVSKDDYSEYVSNLKSSGFIEESYSSGFFKGTDAEGYVAELWYYGEDERMSISIYK